MAFFKSLDSITHSVITPRSDYLIFKGGEVLEVSDPQIIAYLDGNTNIIRCDAVGECDTDDSVKPLSLTTIGDAPEKAPEAAPKVVSTKTTVKKATKNKKKSKKSKTSKKKKDQNDVDK